MKIAAYLDTEGLPASLYRPGSLHVFEDSADGETRRWRPCALHTFGIDDSMSLDAVKAEVARVVDAIGADCRVLLSGEIRGLPYSVLQEWHGFRTWRSDGPLAQQLDFVRERENEAQAQKKYELVVLNNQSVPAPMLTLGGAPGYYWIDLRAALEHPSNPTSRNILIPFLQTGAFVKLEVLCGHLPKWMAWEFERMDYAAESEPIDGSGDGGLRVSVYSRQTPEGLKRPRGLAGAGAALALPCSRERARQRAPALAAPRAGGAVVDVDCVEVRP